MRRILQVAVLLSLAVVLGCTERGRAPRVAHQDEGETPHVRPKTRPVLVRHDRVIPAAEVLPELPGPSSKEDRYEAALVAGLDALAERDYPRALGALEKAQRINDTGNVQREIDKVRALLAQQESAARAATDLRGVLDDGQPREAARLANEALKAYGGGTSGEELMKLKRQADAVVVAGLTEREQRLQLRADADDAIDGDNLRGAVVACEHLLALGEDPALRKRYEEVSGRLARYENCRSEAARLRKEGNLDEAVGQLREAAKAWDTLQVRLEIDEHALVQQMRRDRVGVADFEVRGELPPTAGRDVADDLLPHFRPRFDLVERGQLGKVLGELKLDAAGLPDDPTGRRELGRLARVRYLVVGSLSPLNGVTLHARLVDVRSGLVAQTARLSAPTLEALIPKLRQAALMLQMSDEQKLAYEEKLARTAALVPVIEVRAELPPPPPVPVAAAPPPPPIVTTTPRPPVLGGLVIRDFERLPPILVAPPPPPMALALVIRREDPRRQRLLALSVELGDNLFRRGRYREAQRHFQVALSLGGGQASLQVRIDRCRPYLPPPVVVAPPPAVVLVPGAPPPVVVMAPRARPRMAVLAFNVFCDPGLVPSALGDWMADQMAGYFGGAYEVIDRGEVCWHMGRLGLTMRDLVADPVAQRCLAQSLNARFFVLGTVQQTASFNVNTHLIDAESGSRTGTGAIHVQDQAEMKLRMGELARQMGAPVGEQAALAKQGAALEKSLNQARSLQKAGQHDKALALTQAALKESPNNTALLSLQAESARQVQRARLEQERVKESAARAVALAAAKKQQEALARQATEARVRAEREAKARGAAAQREAIAQKQRAAESLRAQAKAALAKGNPALAVSNLQSAVALAPSDPAFRELGEARAALERTKKAEVDAARLQRELQARKQREAAQAALRVEQEKRARLEADRHKVQESRDLAVHDNWVRQAKDLLAKKQYDAALAAAQSARRLRASPESAALVRQAQEGRALAEAERKGATARAEAARRLAEERKKREAADLVVKQKQQGYLAAMNEAGKAAAERRYDVAIGRYQSALKLFPADAAAQAGLRSSQDAQKREAAAVNAERQKGERVRVLLAEGNKQLAARQFDRAVKAYQDARVLAPGNAEVLGALSRAERERDTWAASQRATADVARRQAEARKLLDAGRAKLAARQYDAAVNLLRQSVAQAPTAEAQAALVQAEKLQADSKRPLPPPVDPRVKQREQDYNLHLQQARLASARKQWAVAVAGYQNAAKVRPLDPVALREFQSAQQMLAALTLPKSPPPPTPKLPPPPPPKTPPVVNPVAEHARWMAQGAALEKGGKYAEAIAAYQVAAKQLPADPRAPAAIRNATYLWHLSIARAAHIARRFPDAVKAYEQALKANPAGADARLGLTRAKAGQPLP